MADPLRKDEGVNYVMFYNIERTLQILPGVCWAVLGIVLLFLEIKNFKEMVKDSPEAGRGGFIPPSGDGYEYFVDSTRIVYVFQRAKNKFRIYLIQGDAPNVSMKHDKHGQYFTVRSESTATAEKIIDNTFHNRVAIP